MAFRALGSTYPNPPVGAIIVKNGIILSRGWTQRSGSFHAEVHAINQIRNKRILNGATLYSTLEPCYHKGKNPPCVDKIIKYKFSKVVISETDKNPKVNGKSIQKLRDSGVEVVKKKFSNKIKKLNYKFFNTILKKKPFITLKIASSADGRIATKDFKSKWITNYSSRIKGHQLRALNDCILVGRGTVQKDNPSLDCRIRGLEKLSPDIFILDSELNLTKNLNIFSKKDRQIYIFTSQIDQKKQIKAKNVNYIILDKKNGMLNMKSVTQKISELGYINILVEGGSELTTSLLKGNFIDKIYWFRSSKIMGNDGLDAIKDLGISKIKQMKRFKLIANHSYSNDHLSVYSRGQ